MHLHILGICGTFMAGIAQIGRELGHTVTGSDQNIYPPMSTLLESMGIEVFPGYEPGFLPTTTDVFIIGNALSRGNPCVESILNNHNHFMSGPEWLRDHVLGSRQVIGVAGTHGKTTTTSMICQILDHCGVECGYLVGGVPGNFEVSARLGHAPWFVIEADEYDTAFFDKRSKFVHYRPQIALLNNLEFDHADIFSNIGQIITQFHHLIRTVPGRGTVIVNADDDHLQKTLELGCWSEVVRFATKASKCDDHWRFGAHAEDFSQFEILSPVGCSIDVSWSLFGEHNARNALGAAAACATAGLAPAAIRNGLENFILPKRRLQHLGTCHDIHVYEDFAHHPTAIAHTLDALAKHHAGARLIAVVEPRSNTMQLGIHGEKLAQSLKGADAGFVLSHPELQWSPAKLLKDNGMASFYACDSDEELIRSLLDIMECGDIVVLMSNGGFQGIPKRLVKIMSSVAWEPGTPDTVH